MLAIGIPLMTASLGLAGGIVVASAYLRKRKRNKNGKSKSILSTKNKDSTASSISARFQSKKRSKRSRFEEIKTLDYAAASTDVPAASTDVPAASTDVAAYSTDFSTAFTDNSKTMKYSGVSANSTNLNYAETDKDLIATVSEDEGSGIATNILSFGGNIGFDSEVVRKDQNPSMDVKPISKRKQN
eukprot:GHVT01035006.1.p1 GENE.GHVT01035006.1~~GHVT01035006.1.p1  ORF type:complete len:186 (+),score=19.74 GHVT01035006.1:2127-2684(+)